MAPAKPDRAGVVSRRPVFHSLGTENFDILADFSNFTLQVQTQDAVRLEADKLIDGIREALGRENMKGTSIERNDPQRPEDAPGVRITIRGLPSAQIVPGSSIRSPQTIKALIERTAVWETLPAANADVQVRMRPEKFASLKKEVIGRAAEILDWRLKLLGIMGAEVHQNGDRPELTVRLPRVDDPSAIKSIIVTKASLEVAQVLDGPFATRKSGIDAHGGVLPLGTKLLSYDGRPEWFLLSKTAVLSNGDVRDAAAVRSAAAHWGIEVVWEPEGSRRFALFSEANTGERVAFVWNDAILTVTKIQSTNESKLWINSETDQRQAQRMALLIRSGSLPVRLTNAGSPAIP
jgi:preprotein translocase subunit SecD